MQTLNIPASVATRGVSLDSVQTVLVKFAFTNPSHIPAGIPSRKVTDKKAEEIEKFNALIAESKGRKDLAVVGRRREGHVDTGVQTVDNLQLVQLAMIRRGLTNVGFQLHAVDVFYRPEKRKHFVVLVFNKGGYYEEATASSEEREAHKVLSSPKIVEALRALANTTWQWCHVWDNSETRGTATINVGGRILDQKPRHAIAVRQGEIINVPLEASIDEGQE